MSKRQRHAPWTSEEDAKILTAALYQAPVWKELAAALGRSYGSVRTRAYLLRFKRNDDVKAARPGASPSPTRPPSARA